MAGRSILAWLLAACGVCLSADRPWKQGGSKQGPASVPARRTSLELAEYRLAAGPIRVEGITDNLSGASYNPKTKTLFCAVDWPAMVVEITTDGKLKRRFKVGEWNDVEGVVVHAADAFAIVEERTRMLVFFQIPPGDEKLVELDRAGARAVLVDPQPAGNQGLEGVAYDPAGKRFFIAKEKRPKQLYVVEMGPPAAVGRGGDPVPAKPADKPKVRKLWTFEAKGIRLGDVSGLHFHPGTGHLLVLSEESRCVIECTLDGKEIGRLAVPHVPKAEGVTMDEKGTLYVVGEPNILLVFRRPRAQSTKKGPE